MKHLLTGILGLVAISLHSTIQAQSSCCAKPADMQTLALRTDFINAHLTPLPLEYSPSKGSMISFPTEGGADGNAFYVPSEGPTMRVLIIFHEWWGLNDYIKREAEQWQHNLGDIDVYAVDLYDGKVATSPDEASDLMSKLETSRGEAIIKGLLQKIGNKKIATLGWCMGGSWSFTGTRLAGNNAVGCVMYYGFPEKDLNKVKQIKADVLYVYGTQDKFIKRLDVDALGKRITNLGYQFQLESYNADHAFANPSNPKYNKMATAQANVITVKFLQQHLGL
jgi:carboxymethylenebutenolidase